MAFMQWARRMALVLVGCAGLWGAAQAQDMAGAKDHPAVKRFGGSSIVGYEVRNFDAVEFQTSTFKEFDLGAGVRRYVQPPLQLEGKLTRFWYEAPGDTRALELYRNYVNELTAGGFQALYDSTKDPAAGKWTNFLASFSSSKKDFVKNARSEYVMYAAEANTIRTGTFQKDNVTVRLVAIDWPKEDRTYKARQGAYIAVDVLETKAMQQNMVVVSASEIGKSLTTQGKVAIYGIYFDTNQSLLKPESEKALAEIAKLLKSDPGLKVYVVGHTDSTGVYEANMKLSLDRAAAVVQNLTTRHGIAASRLKAGGAGPLAPMASNDTEAGKAKNRRVELVKQ